MKIKQTTPILLFIAIDALLLLSACGGGGGSSAKKEPQVIQPIVSTDDGWEKCRLPQGYSTRATCKIVEVPLDWGEPEGKKIDQAIIRFKPESESDKDIWLIDGGPGRWGQSYASEDAQALIRDRNIYIPSFRGTGASSFLTCATGGYDESVEAMQSCFDDLYIQYGDQLNQFNTYNGAQDIKFLIDEFSPEEHQTVLYGLSFGGYIVQRYLQYANDQVDAIVLDSAMHLQPTMHLAEYESDETGYLILDYCEQDEFCREKLGGDPHSYFESTYQGLASGSCPAVGNNEEQLSLSHVKLVFEFVIRERRYSLLPALIYRFNRCNEEDIELFSYLVEEGGEDGDDYVGGTAPVFTETDMSGLIDNAIVPDSVAVIEAFDTEMSKEEFLQLNDDMRFTDLRALEWDIAQVWDVPKIPFNNEPQNTLVPMLILHTDTDSQAIPEHGAMIAADYPGDNHYYIEVPRMTHYTGLVAWHSCPKNILRDFLANPEQKPNTECIDTIPAINFKLDDEYGRYLSQEFFELENLWPEE